MTTYYIHTQNGKITDKLILQTTSKKKAMQACDGCTEAARVTKFVKWNHTTPVVYCNARWTDEILNTTKWAKGAITLGDW